MKSLVAVPVEVALRIPFKRGPQESSRQEASTAFATSPMPPQGSKRAQHDPQHSTLHKSLYECIYTAYTDQISSTYP